nr:hypothetical protein [Lachnospiraceae bacterium]
ALLCFNKPEDYLNKDFKFPKIKAKQIRIEVRSDKAEFNVGGKKAKIDGGSVTNNDGLSMQLSVNQDTDENDAKTLTVWIDGVEKGTPIEIKTQDRSSESYAKATVETEDGFYSAGSGRSLTLTINEEGSATLKPEKNTVSSCLAAASNKTKGKLYAITATASANSITLTPSENGARISAQKEGTEDIPVDITVAGDTLKTQFPDTGTENGDLIVRTEDGSAEILKEKGGSTGPEEAEEPSEKNWGEAPEEGDFPGSRPDPGPVIPTKAYFYKGYEIIEDWKWNGGKPVIKIRMKYESADGDTSPSEELTLYGTTEDPESETYRTYTAKTTAKYVSKAGDTKKAEVVLMKKYDKDGNSLDYILLSLKFRWPDTLENGSALPAVTADAVYQVKENGKEDYEEIQHPDVTVEKNTKKSTDKTSYFTATVTLLDGTTRSEEKRYNANGKIGSNSAAPEESDEITWNLFYNRSGGILIPTGGIKLTDVNGSVGKNNQKSDNYYDLAVESGGLKVTLKSSILKDTKKRKEAAAAGNSIILLPVYDAAGNTVGKFEYSLPVYYAAPKLKLSVASGTVRKDKETVLNTTVLEKKSTNTYEVLDLSEASVGGSGVTKNSNETGVLNIRASAKKTISISIQDKDWSAPVTLKYTVNATAKDVITTVCNGADCKKIILNTNATGQNLESFEVDVMLNGKEYVPGKEEEIKVTAPKKDGGFVIKGIVGNTLSGCRITISYPVDKTKLVKGTYSYKLKAGQASRTFKVVVSNAALAGSVGFKQQAKLNVTTGQKLILTPVFKGISGTIGDAIVAEDKRFEAEYMENLNQIVVSVAQGQSVKAKKKIKTKLSLEAGRVKCSIPVTIIPAATKPTIRIRKVVVPKGKGAEVSGVTNVWSFFKQGGKTITIEPDSIVPVSYGKKSKITRVTGKTNVYTESVTGATITVNEDHTLTVTGSNLKSGSIRISAVYSDGTKATGTLSVVADPTLQPPKKSEIPVKEDNDKTGFTPKDWSWEAGEEGYGRVNFTSGKYVREDGMAVAYIDSGDSSDFFSYQLYQMAMGSKQESYEAKAPDGTSYCVAQNSSKTDAQDSSNGLTFKSPGDGSLIVTTNWDKEMYDKYDDPAGTYYLVREKKKKE